MSRLGMLYALTDAETDKLRAVPIANRYEYMLDEIEEKLFGTARACELDKAWFSIQYCLGGGSWHEEDAIPYNIVFGGEFLVDTDDEVITLKNHEEVARIAEYLRQNNLQEIIRNNFWNIADNDFPYKDANGFKHALYWCNNIPVFYDFPYKDANGFKHALYWCNNIPVFYDNSQNNSYQVIFSVDL